MKKNKILLLFFILAALGASTWFIASNDLIGKFFNEGDPDRPPLGVKKPPLDEYLQRRIEHMEMLFGYDTAEQHSRTNSILEMEKSEERLRKARREANQPEGASWVSVGPAPIPVNASTSYSGRVSAIAVHPTNPDIVYVGTAQGGLYRSLNGGATWVPLMDNALTIAIGAVAISPSDPTTIFVGTGESTLCSSGCYIGVGLYRITNADTTPVLSAALNKDAANADIFTGRAISEVLVHPTDPNTVFVGTSSGVAGIGGTTTGAALPARGVYRTTNAMSASPTFARLDVAGISERSVTDLAMEPGNPNRIYVGVLGVSAGDGGVYSTANALDAAPTFTQTLSTAATGSNSRIELAAVRVTDVTTVYAASGEGTGTIYKSIDSAPFTLVLDNNFCNPQCFYDIAIAVDPTNAQRVFLGGSPALVFGRSTNGGASFASSASGLHVDTQAITVAPSNPNIVYFGSDGGIWRTTNVSATPIVWNTLNNTTISATQFMGISVHPTDRNYSLGGTQDNGTQFLAPDGQEWVRSDGGDGGFSVIDQDSPDTTSVVAYHTYYNQTNSQIGFARATTTVPPGDPAWADFLGCGGTANGLICSDPVLFYAPMVGGPTVVESTGNTLYFGTNKLYRSIDQGTTMTPVGSAGISARISAIAIAPQDDNIRLVGTSGGAVFLQSTPGATTLTNITGAIAPSARYIGRTAIDPTDANIAYVCLNGFGLSNGQHVWKTTNLLSGSPTWVASGNGIPDTPVNSFVIDPLDTDTLYAGSDIGVFKSTDGGANWIPFSDGLPRVAVFGMAIQPTSRVLRISTHGRGMYDYDLSSAPMITGTITYGNALGNPVPPRLVKTVTVQSTVGSPSVGPVVTGTPGTYTLTGFGAGAYTLTPSKTGGPNSSITSADAARIAQGVVGTSFANNNQRFAADASGNGSVSSNDAAFVARFAAGLTGTGNAGQWRFFIEDIPGVPSGPFPTLPAQNRSYASVTGSVAGEDYIGLLVGDATGNWNPATHPRPAVRSEQSIVVELPNLTSSSEKEIVIPVRVQGAADNAITSYEFDLRYDPTAIKPLVDSVDVKGTASRGLSVVTNPHEPGLLRVVVYGAMPMTEDGVLLNLRFTAVGKPGAESPLSFERIMFNEDEVSVAAVEGRVEL